jgi:sugar/nucleoside kinase (ribokinase family)
VYFLDKKMFEVTVAGHICLDIIPSINRSLDNFKNAISPGNLIDIGDIVSSTGGAVSNTGLALHRLGVKTQLMGKIGDDLFGQGILSLLQKQGEGLTRNMIISPGEQTSYSIVLSPQNMDRVFLHCPGTNGSYTATDISLESIKHSRFFHFGYPPLMKKLYENEGQELEKLLKLVKSQDLTVTLDLSKPDPNSEAGRINWKGILKRVLPFVDVIFPSFEEILYMVNREQYEEYQKNDPSKSLIDLATPELLREISSELIKWGTPIVVIKLGEHGLYVRTTVEKENLQQMGQGAPDQLESWLGREILAPPFEVDVIGTTGAGDCTIAGFLAGLAKGYSFEETVMAALAVGAFNVEHVDATSGIPKWEMVKERINRGWVRKKVQLPFGEWSSYNEGEFLFSSCDRFLNL